MSARDPRPSSGTKKSTFRWMKPKNSGRIPIAIAVPMPDTEGTTVSGEGQGWETEAHVRPRWPLEPQVPPGICCR